jgi:hypothetical protein
VDGRAVIFESEGRSGPTVDDCLIPGADAMSDIQPSATLELPQNSTLCVSSLMILSLPLSEETLANADGESPTVSTTLNQTTIESSSAASIVTEAALYDIELSEDVLSLKRDIFGKVYYSSFLEKTLIYYIASVLNPHCNL